MIRIPLRISGVNLDDDVTLELLAENLSDLAWSECDGVTLATLYTPANNPVATALEAARRICHALSDAEVLDVHQDLVSVSDVAFRLGVSREAVRLWVEGLRGPGGFPPPAGVIGNGRSKVWPWAAVNEWAHRNYRIGDNEAHLTSQQVAELNAALLRVKNPIDSEWETVSSFQKRVRPADERAEHFHELLARLTEGILSARAKGHMNWALHLVEGARPSWVARYGHHHPDGYLEVSSETAQIEELT
ncbi:hypothetical protein [Polymorphospora rubra]|uniref:DNA-binding protein n=1 Tax=Polymorphospora rubra TaxID=338584 RepID=A0A810MZ37_9ACTN|nr:hypothetical protein [Polymorphospora rubra]BCJ65724.1 hypothetical protein Prubr_27450 [Polymorphospora rubra]